MRLYKKILLRPRCENCGKPLYLSHSPFKGYNQGDVPSHCPNCGKEVSQDQKNNLEAHEGLICFLMCSIVIAITVVALIIVTFLK